MSFPLGTQKTWTVTEFVVGSKCKRRLEVHMAGSSDGIGEGGRYLQEGWSPSRNGTFKHCPLWIFTESREDEPFPLLQYRESPSIVYAVYLLLSSLASIEAAPTPSSRCCCCGNFSPFSPEAKFRRKGPSPRRDHCGPSPASYLQSTEPQIHVPV